VASKASKVTGFAGRYANALYDLAREAGALEAVENDLNELSRAVAASTDLQRMLKSPVFSRDDQWKAMDAILARMRVSDLTRRFVGVVAAHRRLFALERIIIAFAKLTARARGETTATVEAAQDLSRAQADALKAALKSALGRRITLIEKREPALLGGLIVRVGSLMVDSSLRTQLTQLEIAMREAS
jgi:F-type H+-transporting ATPase subunit delta